MTTSTICFFGRMIVRKKKYRLTKWGIIGQPIDQGGMCVKNIAVQNKCLLSKWLFKLINEDGLWQQNLVSHKPNNRETTKETGWFLPCSTSHQVNF
jgi:hypothetical protein